MENPVLDPIVVLKVKNLCCTAYQKKLNKELYRLDGVISISINPYQSLVTIRGKVEPDLLLHTIAKTGKYAEMVYFNKNPSNSSDNHHAGEFRHGENADDRQRWTGKQSCFQQFRSCCCKEKKGHKKEEREEDHKCEKYVPPPLDEGICRDYYCRDHRMRPIFGGNPYNFGYFPNHACLGSHPSYRSSAYGYHSGRIGAAGLGGGYGLSRWWRW